MTLSRRAIATISLILVAILFIAVNLALDTFLRSARIDLTENQIHTLSEGTRKTLAKIDEPVTFKLYYSEETATGVANVSAYAGRVRDLLAEYAAQSDGKLRVEEIKPTPDSDEEDEATQEGLQEQRIRGSDLKIYFGLVGTNTVGGKQVIPYFSESRDQYLEYDLTSMVSQLSARQKPKLGIVTSLPLETGPGGMAAAMQGRGQPYVIYQQLQENFELEMLDQDFDRVPETVSTLMIAHPPALSAKTLYAIDQFVMRGGHVIAFVDPLSEISQLAAQGAGPMAGGTFSSDLAPLLKSWGVQYDPNVVVADRALAIDVGQEGASYVLYLQIKEPQLNQEDITTSQVTLLNIGTPGAFRPAEGATTTFTPLIQTSEDSQELTAEQMRMAPPQPAELLSNFLPTGQRYTIAARVAGPAASAYPDGAPPEEPKPEEATPDPSKPPEAPKPPLPAHLKEATAPINVIVVADSDLFDDRFWVRVDGFMAQVFADNYAFVLNSVQNMMGSNDLISLRTRKRVERPFSVTKEMRDRAERKELLEIRQLQARLDETNRRINELKGAGGQGDEGDAAEALLTPEQNAEVQALEAEALQTRKTLRGVRRELRSDIDSLGNWLAFINIALMPILIVALAIALAYRRRVLRNRRLEGAGA
jgi:ABC-type uncharacterized transport system involved in gliding motility auxiliary subunit